RLPVVTTSFHGRDVFAPAAAHVVLGVPLAELGPAYDVAQLVRLDWPVARVAGTALETSTVYADTFGNLKLAGELADLEAAVGTLAPGDELALAWSDGAGAHEARLPWVATFGRVVEGQPLVYQDSYGRLGLAANQASVAALLDLHPDQRLTIRRG
ncbi:MAG: SAM hydroxide adenosyltransferase, partial [Candidatus Limnocylindrales bacterium]